jgi:polyhydroxyalkanoate synthesis regulator protein
MQGMMGSYLEKNIQTFMELQDRLADQSKGLFGGANLSPEAWTQFMSGQTPVMQNMMNSYVEQSKDLFGQMQEKLQEQAKAMFPAFPFSAGSASEKTKS